MFTLYSSDLRLTHQMIVWLLLLIVTVVQCQDFCHVNTYNSSCKYACRCKGPCDSDGNCIGSSCSEGWFGSACQYSDVVMTATIHPKRAESLRSNSSGHDCGQRFGPHYVLLTWIEEQPFTWLRIIILNQTSLTNMSISINNASCAKTNIFSVDDTTMDIACNTNVSMTTLKLEGEDVGNICTLFVSGVDSERHRLNGFLLEMLDSHNATLDQFQDDSSSPKLVYSVLIRTGSYIAARVRQKSTTNPQLVTYVSLNEFEAYGECLPGFWGLNCKEKCPPFCNTSCHAEHGKCNTIYISYTDLPQSSIGPNTLNTYVVSGIGVGVGLVVLVVVGCVVKRRVERKQETNIDIVAKLQEEHHYENVKNKDFYDTEFLRDNNFCGSIEDEERQRENERHYEMLSGENQYDKLALEYEDSNGVHYQNFASLNQELM
ncbi:uncharacterized protein LOC106066879 isoform X2 [Biomphalaria glabrata]|uniref:Uncharacterized protein LOC106066879 isoform X2 n=1 Tax=Biomphalaria glabrata TaxID=6526 RepID=A0A9W3AD11_BIOGL|nr:uncharacterized protein LOC106066879 isoform X2 [Biomphalaria glabrata]